MYANAYDQIIEYLFLGSKRAVDTYAYQFSMIVNCTRSSDIPFPKNDTIQIRIPINDDPSDCDKLGLLIQETRVLEQIHESIVAKQPVLVHCFAGMQRSCALVACYLIKYYGMTPDEAVEYIRHKRPIAFFGEVNFKSAIDAFYVNNIKTSL